jgi:type II secretory pathway pseudopilin PulG
MKHQTVVLSAMQHDRKQADEKQAATQAADQAQQQQTRTESGAQTSYLRASLPPSQLLSPFDGTVAGEPSAKG